MKDRSSCGLRYAWWNSTGKASFLSRTDRSEHCFKGVFSTRFGFLGRSLISFPKGELVSKMLKTCEMTSLGRSSSGKSCWELGAI